MYVATYGTPSQIISNALLDHFFHRVCVTLLADEQESR